MNLENLKTDFLGKKIKYFDNLDSTHKFAKSLPEEEQENGMVILADNQLSGIRNSWQKVDY